MSLVVSPLGVLTFPAFLLCCVLALPALVFADAWLVLCVEHASKTQHADYARNGGFPYGGAVSDPATLAQSPTAGVGSPGMSVPESVPGAGAVTQLAIKVLGPTADYLGERLLDSVKATENMVKVLGKAIKKLGSRAGEPGYVPARVVKEFLNEAPFAEDEFMAEYISGVLASSRTPQGRDDTAVAMLAQVGRLSTYAIRAHFVLSVTARELIKGTEYRLGINR